MSSSRCGATGRREVGESARAVDRYAHVVPGSPVGIDPCAVSRRSHDRAGVGRGVVVEHAHALAVGEGADCDLQPVLAAAHDRGDRVGADAAEDGVDDQGGVLDPLDAKVGLRPDRANLGRSTASPMRPAATRTITSPPLNAGPSRSVGCVRTSCEPRCRWRRAAQAQLVAECAHERRPRPRSPPLARVDEAIPVPRPATTTTTSRSDRSTRSDTGPAPPSGYACVTALANPSRAAIVDGFAVPGISHGSGHVSFLAGESGRHVETPWKPLHGTGRVGESFAIGCSVAVKAAPKPVCPASYPGARSQGRR